MNLDQLERAMAADLRKDLDEALPDLDGRVSRGLARRIARRSVRAFIRGAVLGLARDGEVRLMGFGTFKTREHPGRTIEIIDRETGEKSEQTTRPSVQVSFRMGTKLKAALREGLE